MLYLSLLLKILKLFPVKYDCDLHIKTAFLNVQSSAYVCGK